MITIYSVPNCSACTQAKQLCTQAGVEFQTIDLTDLSSTETMRLTEQYGVIRKAPLLVADGNVLKNNIELREYLNEVK